jgi:hypothetical protein
VHVNVRVPIALLRAGVRLASFIDQPNDVSVDIDHKHDDVKIKIYAE